MNERFEGIVLFKRPHRERDLLVKIFTEQYGTKMFFVKHAKRSNHPLAAQLFPLTLNHYIGDIHTEGLSFIREGHTVHLYQSLHQDYLKQAYAVYIAQLVDAAIDDNVPNAKLYQLFWCSLQLIDEGFSPEIIVVYMEIHLLTYFGIKIDWHHCRKCEAEAYKGDFSMIHQGVLCQKHWHEDEHRMRIAPKALYIAQILAKTDLNQIQSVNLSNQTMLELRRLMDEVYQEYVGIRLKSKRYLDQITSIQQLMNDTSI